MFLEQFSYERSARTSERVKSRFLAVFSIAILFVSAALGSSVFASEKRVEDQRKPASTIEAPVNIAILIQDDLVSSVGNEIRVTSNFIRTLPPGSRVMVGYITSGSLQVRMPFTSDLNSAAHSLRIPFSSTAASPYNPYLEVIEAIRTFDSNNSGRNVILLISDGLDVSRGFDSTAAGNTIDLLRAIKEANARNISIFSFYAPSVGLTSRSRLAASYGQSSLNRISDETGGRAFFQGTSGFVTFDPYFDQLRRAHNQRT
jgi:hypothetical protein